MEKEIFIWLGLLIVFLVIEIATVGLTSIWLAGCNISIWRSVRVASKARHFRVCSSSSIRSESGLPSVKGSPLKRRFAVLRMGLYSFFHDAKRHKVVFVGRDRSGTPRYAHVRGTADPFRQDIAGSDKSYPFRHEGNGNQLFVFEAPIKGFV